MAHGPGPTGPRSRKKIFLRHTFWPKRTQKKFRPKRMKGGRVIRPFIYHRVTESQSHRVTESQSHRVTESQSDRVTPLPLPIRVGENFLCPFSINSPTRFARRGIKQDWCLAVFKPSTGTHLSCASTRILSSANLFCHRLDPQSSKYAA